MSTSRAAAFGWVVFAYLLALGGAALTLWALPELGLLARVAVADVVATLVVFVFARAFRNDSFYDPYWSVAPVIIAAYLASRPGEPPPLREALVLVGLAAYGVRLTANWATGWSGLEHEDWRYVDLREKTGRAYPLVSLLGIMLMPTALVFLGCLPLWPALVTHDAPLSALDGLAFAVLLGGTVLEGAADRQLRAFARARPDRNAVMDRGLWAWSRHPNYLGEILVWVGLALFGWASGGLELVHLSGVATMVALFLGISIPMMERRQLARKPAYAAYRRRTSMLLPRPPRRDPD